MIDIKLIRENPDIVENDLKKRGNKEKLEKFHELMKLDKERRDIIQKVEKLKHERNVITSEIQKTKAKTQKSKKIKLAKDLAGKIKELENKLGEMETKCNLILMTLPNILHESVPVGSNEEDNQEIKKHSIIPTFNFKPKDHIDLGLNLGMIDIERAAKISGARFYFLKGQLALLDMALMRFAIDFMVKKDFLFVIPPHMMHRKYYEGVTDLTDFEEMLYKIENEDLYMIATAEHPLMAQHMDETFNSKELPIKYVGLSTNFRKEAGSHGKDTKGIFRVHQFNKVEQTIICKPEDSWEWHENIMKNTEEFFKLLEIPFRVVNICTGDIGTVAAKKYDIEAWLPAQQKYREMGSCSNCTDYQARRLNIKYREKEGLPPKGLVHTLNNTVVTDRTLVAIMENNQQEDGSILVPKILHQYLSGIKRIEKKS